MIFYTEGDLYELEYEDGHKTLARFKRGGFYDDEGWELRTDIVVNIEKV